MPIICACSITPKRHADRAAQPQTTFRNPVKQTADAGNRSLTRKTAASTSAGGKFQDSYRGSAWSISTISSASTTVSHLYGDEVLILMANLMRRAICANDWLYRFGGENSSWCWHRHRAGGAGSIHAPAAVDPRVPNSPQIGPGHREYRLHLRCGRICCPCMLGEPTRPVFRQGPRPQTRFAPTPIFAGLRAADSPPPISMPNCSDLPRCRSGCGACCIGNCRLPARCPACRTANRREWRASIWMRILRCKVFGRPERPDFCGGLQPSREMCGDDRSQALLWLTQLERLTRP